MALKDLAREAGMTPAKAHPYLVSFGKLGLIEPIVMANHFEQFLKLAPDAPERPEVTQIMGSPVGLLADSS